MDERSWTTPGYRHKSRGCPVSFNEVEKLTEEKYTIRKYKRILFYVVILVLLAAFLLGQSIYPSERETVTEESITYTGTFYRVLADGTKEEIPVPIMFYIDSVQQGRYRKVYHVAECITCVNFVLCTALQLLNIADFISTMFLSHLVIAGTFLTIFITICRDLIKGTAKHYKLPLIGLVAAMIAVMLEVTAVYRVVSLSGIFIATGLVVLLVVTLIQTMDRIRELELARQREARESLDYLTGLPMRHKGEKLILEKMQEHDGCLGFVDMDNLKKINDVYGHKAGDRALRLVGAMLTECMENAVVCRLGGDEFLFYLPEASEAEMSMRIRKLFDSFGAAKNVTAETSPASLSCGLCMCRQGGNFEEYYIKADKALYYVKQNGKNNYRFYEELEEQ